MMISPLSRLLAFLLAAVLVADPAHAQDYAYYERAESDHTVESVLNTPANLNVDSVKLARALAALHESSGVMIAYSPSLLPSLTVSCACRDVTLGQALTTILEGTGFRGVALAHQVLVEPVPERLRHPLSSQTNTVFASRVAGTGAASAPGRPALPVVDQGTVAGEVTDAQTGRPLSSAQVHIEGTDLGTLTNADGRYVISSVPAGEVTISVTLIGYGQARRTVTVGDGQTVTTDFELRETAVSLDEIVVTGTPGAERRRSIGNAVGQIDADEINLVSATSQLQNVLGGAEPGVSISFSGGTTNPGSVIRIRGAASISLNSEPLVFIDGVRANAGRNIGAGTGGEAPPLRLNDLDPEEIASVEVVKGPAAATLYGTEASNGVINIITKRGKTGAPVFTATIRQGISQMPGGMENAYSPTYYRCQGLPGSGCTAGEIVEVNVLKEERERFGDVWFGTGYSQMYNARVSGGSDRVTYFFSGSHNDDTGISADDWKKRWNARANLKWTPSGKLGIQVGIGSVWSEARNPSANQPVTLGIFLACPSPGCEPGSGEGALDGAFRGYFAYTPEALINNVFGLQDLSRQTLNLTVTQNPYSWLSGRLVVGTDLTRTQATLLHKPLRDGQVGHFLPEGRKIGTSAFEDIYTADYSLTATMTPTSGISLASSAGLQYYQFSQHVFSGSGADFPISTLETVGSGARREASESFEENKTVGVFAQQRVSWRDRVFVTGAIRFDDNSAFGQNFDMVSYPKLSASWVISEEAFMRHIDWLGQLRLRTAWGMAGQQPSTFAAVRTYSPVTGPGGVGTITRQNIGNPNLEPEVGAEWEAGLDGGFLNDRFGVELTYYNQAREKAIVSVPVKPSTGFPGTQFRNLGRIRNTGIELGAHGLAYEDRRFALDLGLSFSHNDNIVESLGGLGPQVLQDSNPGTGWARQRYAEGFPLGAIFLKKVVSAEIEGSGPDARAVNIMCEGGDIVPGTSVLSRGGGAPVPCDEAPEIYRGTPVPSTIASANATLTMFDNLELYAQVDYEGGATVVDGNIALPHLFGRNSRAILERTDPILLALDEMGSEGINQSGLVDASFARLRRIAVTYHFPQALTSRMGTSRASLVLSGRNIAWLWQKESEKFGHKVVDHEQRRTFTSPMTALQAYRQEGWPTLRQFSATMRVTF